MPRPWNAERAVPPDLARELVEAAFPALAPATLVPLGAGWDNTAYLVRGELVFRFPRRAVAVPLLETEACLLPRLAPRLPLAVPVPAWVGAPTERFPWPFAGYRRLPGTPAHEAGLDAAARAGAAAPLGRFLAALHRTPGAPLRALGAPGDEIGRLDVARRARLAAERLREAARLGLVDDPRRWDAALDDAPRDAPLSDDVPCHGDLDGRHVLVDEGGAPSGVLDWGDAHLGDPAVDLALAYGFLPPAARETFLDAYGPVDDARLRLARLRAVHQAAAVLVWGADVGDAALVREGRAALAHAATA